MINRGLAFVWVGLLATSGIAMAQGQGNERDRSSLSDFPEGATGGTHMKGNAGHSAPNKAPANLINHSGPVLAPANYYFLWWGSWNDSTKPTQDLLRTFVGGLGNIDLFKMMQQYSSATVGLSYLPGNDFTDTSTPPARNPSTSAIISAVCTATHNNPDSNGMYAVLTSNFPKGANYCAWHSWGSCTGGAPVQVIYEPNPTGVLGCNVSSSPNSNQQADSTANTLSHEIFETVTDPRGNAWYDKNGEEIGDKCAWMFSPSSGATNSVGGLGFVLQEEWDNSVTGCVQH